MSDAEFIMREVVDGVATDTPISREEMFGPNLLSQALPDALTQALARLEALEAQVRELQGHRHGAMEVSWSGPVKLPPHLVGETEVLGTLTTPKDNADNDKCSRCSVQSGPDGYEIVHRHE